MKKYMAPVMMLAIFETAAVTLWLTKDSLLYLFNFSYTGCSIALGVFLSLKRYEQARRVTQLLAGLYMLAYLRLTRSENMQIEGFWYYLFTGVFEAALFFARVGNLERSCSGRSWLGTCCIMPSVSPWRPFSKTRRFLTDGGFRAVR